MYADALIPEFPDHQDLSPHYPRSANTRPRSIVNSLRGTYLKNPPILIHPITRKSFGQTWLNYASMANFADRTTRDYGGWDTPAVYVFTPYMWLANFSAIPKTKLVNALGKESSNLDENEPPWPRNTSECERRRAF